MSKKHKERSKDMRDRCRVPEEAKREKRKRPLKKKVSENIPELLRVIKSLVQKF